MFKVKKVLLDSYIFQPENFPLTLTCKKTSPPQAGGDRGEGEKIPLSTPTLSLPRRRGRALREGNFKYLWLVLLLCPFLFISSVCFADESEIFTLDVAPDVLIILDLSGSMNWDPAGKTCSSPGCTRLEMGKAAIKTILDYNRDGSVDVADENLLGVRIGYMRYYYCTADDTGGSYSSGCNSLIKELGRPYSEIWTAVNNESAYGGTPLAAALHEGRLYLDANKSSDSAKNCRQKFVILVTDGADTFACSGNGSESQSDQYKRRKATVAKAKALADAGYKVFVVGFGEAMPDHLEYTLNWAAYLGGTDNPDLANTGSTSAIAASSDPCAADTSNDPGTASLRGYAFLTTKSEELSAALLRTINIIAEARVSFTVTSVAASRTQDENFMYEASFRPINNDPFWLGYFKKFSINSDGSLGSQVWDAGNVLQSKDPATRNMFSLQAGSLASFLAGAPGQTKTYLDVQTAEEAMAIVGYIRGESAYNPDRWKLGDIFHSGVLTIGSPSAYYIDIRSPQAFVDFRENNKNRERIIVTGANDGQFHAFRASDGDEKWSFIPPNLRPKLKYIAHYSHPTSLTHSYFVDGPVTVADAWLGTGDGTTKSSSDWKTLLIFGLGKGVRDSSNNSRFLWSSSSSCDSEANYSQTYTSTYQYYCGYYAFDVTTTSASTPVYKWRLNFPAGGPQTQAYLGESWSRMAIGRVKIYGYEKWVGFIGGGYSSGGDTGKGFFVVDLSNGDILWSFTKGASDTNTTSTNMTYTIPASPAIADTDSDGFIDTAYVGDLGGNMWRFKFCTQTDASTCSTSNWSGGRLFNSSVGSGFIRPIYATAAVAKSTGGSLWVFWGTGNKENPSGTSGQDHFFAVKDNDRTTTYNINNLENITTEGTTYSGANPGWYMTLGGTGEKLLSEPAVFGGIVAFTTYTPSGGSDSCSSAGTAKLYAMAMMPMTINGITYNPGAGVLSEPTVPSSTAGGARSRTLGYGIPKSPVFSQKPGGTGPTDLYLSLSGGGGSDTRVISSSQLGDNPLTQHLVQTAPSSQLLHWRDGRIQ